MFTFAIMCRDVGGSELMGGTTGFAPFVHSSRLEFAIVGGVNANAFTGLSFDGEFPSAETGEGIRF